MKNKQTIFIARHGKIDKSTLLLNDEGNGFAEYIRKTFEEFPSLGFIACSNVVRCIQTVLPLAGQKNLKINTYDGFDFTNATPLKHSLTHKHVESLIVCRYQDFNHVLQSLGLDTYGENTKDYLYNKIIRVQINEKDETSKYEYVWK